MRMKSAFLVIMMITAPVCASNDVSADFQKADKALNETYKDVEKRLANDSNGKARLISAQRAWIAFRDAECTFQSSGEDGGTAAPMVVAACRTSLTTARTGQLKGYLNCQEGDLSCPVPSK